MTVPAPTLVAETSAEYSVIRGLEAAERFNEALDGWSGQEIHWQLYGDDHKGGGATPRGTLDELSDFLTSQNKLRKAICRTINFGGRKANEITRIVALWVDLDGVELPEKWHVQPSMIVRRDDRHHHAYWILSDTVEVTPETAALFKQYQVSLADFYGGDKGVSDLSRVMRVPGFKHYKEYPTTYDVTLHLADDPPRYTLEDIMDGVPLTVETQVNKGINYDGEPDLPQHKHRAHRWLRQRDPAIDNNQVDGADGNNHTMATAAALAEFALSPDGIVEVMFRPDPIHGFKSWAERCRGPWDPDELLGLVERAVKKVMENGNWGRKISTPAVDGEDVPDDVEDESTEIWFQPVVDLNERFAVVTGSELAGNIADLADPRSPVMLSKQKFELMLKPRKVIAPPKKDGDAPEPLPVPPLWLSWAGRREITGLEVCPPGGRRSDPTKHNLWQGFAVEPKEGEDHEGFLGHLKANVCGGNQDRYDWLLNWCADLVQYPGRKRGIGVTLHSEEFGTGKSVVFEHFKAIFGRHAYSADSVREITGQFNSHLAGNILLGIEEGFWSGDRQAESKLRNFMTNPALNLELKGVNITSIDNYSRVLVTSNNSWAVPIQRKDRRWYVLDVDPRRKDDFSYWAPIWDALNHGDAAANLLHYLLNCVEVDEELLFRPPMTGAKAKQALETLEPEGKWWMAVLEGHRDPWVMPSGIEMVRRDDQDGIFNAESLKDRLYGDYLEYAKTAPGWPLGETAFWMRFWKMVPESASQRKLGGGMGRVFGLPSRAECQEFFAGIVGTTWGALTG